MKSHYRLLNVGETIIAGDEWRDDDTCCWLKLRQFHGKKVEDIDIWRRPILSFRDKPKPKKTK